MTQPAPESAIDPGEHVGLVVNIVKKYQHLAFGCLQRSDLVQEGLLGVIRAAEDYDPEQGRFSTYASHWIRHFVLRAIANHRSTVRVPVHAQAGKWSGHDFPIRMLYLDNPLGGDDGATHLDHLESNEPDGFDARHDEDRVVLARALLHYLDERERTVIQLRLLDKHTLTLEQVGHRMGGLSRERVRQIQAGAMVKMRKAALSLGETE